LRRDDVLPLAMQLLSGRCRPGEQIPALSADAAHLLLTYPWPGNVRELDNLLQRALILVNGPVIRQEHIQFELANETAGHEPATVSMAPVAAAAAANRAARILKAHAADSSNTASMSASGGATANPGGSLANSLDQTERDLILNALRSGQGSRREAAERLGISQRTLRYKLARLREAGIDVPAA
jgi:two-component system, response regulator FlrC